MLLGPTHCNHVALQVVVADDVPRTTEAGWHFDDLSVILKLLR